MKTFIKLTLVLILLCNLSSYGSHLKGGEITWQCQGSQYVFTLKLYRDCNGIPLSTSQQLGSTIPGYSVIPVTLIADNDLTPPGCSFSCNNPFVGSVEEFIFTSGPITINGTPPTNGWEIYWNYECCRNATDNITPVSSQMHLRSWMYPYNPGSGNLNANPCYDNSPRFASPPTAFICVGYSFNQNAMGTDKDNDSLSYSFAYAQDDNAGVGINDPYINGFSIDSIMPGNPTIDSITGELHIFPTGSVSGNYTLATEVASYRCGQLIATVFR